MNIQKQFLTTSVVFFSLMLPVKTLATSLGYSQIFAFGDSLTDTGNVFQVSQGAIPPVSFGYANGRFSNGLNWLDYLTQDLDLNPIASLVEAQSNINLAANGINFAFAGATTGTENTVALTFPELTGLPGLQQQIGAFLNFKPIAKEDALYIIWAGANDYLPTDSTFTPRTESGTSTTYIASGVNTLVNNGAKNLMVVNLPDLAKLPLTNILPESEQQEFTTLTNSHNQQLKSLSYGLPDDVNLIQFDVNNLLTNIIANPANVGFSNVTEGCLLVIGCYDPINNVDLSSQYLFWDDKHPTTAAHKIIANAAFDALKPVPESSPLFGLLVVGTVGTVTLLNRKSND
jgi:phospholipase/lecithinase/hemolysin